jgi:hypothetical protein
MPSKPPPRAKGPAKPPRPATPARAPMPTIEVDVAWLEAPTDAGKRERTSKSAGEPPPTVEAPRRDTIPVQPEWLEIEDDPPPAPAPPRVPRPAGKAVAKKSPAPPKRSR